jgi:hypothetical protein
MELGHLPLELFREIMRQLVLLVEFRPQQALALRAVSSMQGPFFYFWTFFFLCFFIPLSRLPISYFLGTFLEKKKS